MIHRMKNRPALQRCDILTIFLVSFFFLFWIGNLLNSSSTQFLVVLFFFIFLILLRAFSWVFFYYAFLWGSVLSSTLDFSRIFYRAFLLSGSVLSRRAVLSSENACS